MAEQLRIPSNRMPCVSGFSFRSAFTDIGLRGDCVAPGAGDIQTIRKEQLNFDSVSQKPGLSPIAMREILNPCACRSVAIFLPKMCTI